MPRGKQNTATSTEGAVKTITKKPIVHDNQQIEPENVCAPEPNVSRANAEFKVKEPLTPHTYVTVRNGFNGKLVYVSKRNGERLVWDEFGAEQEMELQELKNAKNASRAFFENNWFMIDDPEVIAYLGVERYYKYALRFEDFDELFTKDPKEIVERVSKLSAGQKASIAYRARQMIAAREIDSIRVIEALEKSLATELVER